MPKALLFENVTCGRCGGTGHYSYNQITGTTCFGCHGAGVKLTPRGNAAQNFLASLRKVSVDKLSIGDKIQDVDGHWATVTGIKRGPGHEFGYTGDYSATHEIQTDRIHMIAGNSALYRKALPKETVILFRDLALEYQSRLNKKGKISISNIDIVLEA